MGKERKLSRRCGTPPYIAPEVHSVLHKKLVKQVIKNDVGCRDYDTVPKTVDTRRHCEED